MLVALDVPDYAQAERLVEALAPLGVGFKVGFEALYGYGERLRGLLDGRGASYALDVKLHDIPRTVGAAVKALVRPGVRLLTLHAIGGNEMMRVAVEAANERSTQLNIPAPGLFAVTLLTSIAPEDLGELGLVGGPGENAIRLAALARDARCAGVVCSAHEIADLKNFFGSDLQTLCPGIRPSGNAQNDQKRAATPAYAAEAGADFIVVGRPITEAPDPVAAAQAILAEIRMAVAP